MKRIARCDVGNIFGYGCENERTRIVTRVFHGGSTVVTHECDDHADDHISRAQHLVVARTLPLTKAA
jgi:hypothetical protein